MILCLPDRSSSKESPFMPRKGRRLGFASIAALAAIGAVAACFGDLPGGPLANHTVLVAGAAETVSRPLAALATDGPWLGDGAPKALRGKVVLVNFWTYSCINSLRPLPYLRDWAEKYKDDGLVVVGVHTPEFAFEKDVGNVRRAAAGLGVNWPVKLDSDYATWKKFGNDGWPGFYFIDANGRVRHHRLGEGDYAASERLLQELLAEANGKPVNAALTGDIGKGIEASPDWAGLGSPETYVGYRQAARLAAPQRLKSDTSAQYDAPASIGPNQWNLAGRWTVGGESARADAASARIRYRFQARDLHLVLGARADGKPARFRVTLDGLPPAGDHGVDVDANGMGSVTSDRLYQLVRQSAGARARTFEIEFLDPGVRAYAFTFG
jgi:thiol-disulfide isomerase/thioredoxin